MNTTDKDKLKATINQIAQLQTEKKEKDDEINEAVAIAAERFTLDKRTIKALARDTRSNEMERAARRLQEEELDNCRLALGLLADTPLGEAAATATEKKSRNGGAKRDRAKEATHPAANA